MSGILYGVSVGPGDPELVTLKAVRTIEKCGVITAPVARGEKRAALSIAEKVCDISGKTALDLSFPMSRDERVLSEAHKTAAEMIIPYLNNGIDAAFVCIGDISVYSTFSYIAKIVKERGFEVEMIPGVTSFCAAAAAVGEPLVTGIEPLIVIPAGINSAEFDKLSSLDGTKILMKSGRSLPEIAKKLQGKTGFAVENAGYPDQRIFNSLDEIGEAGYFTTVVFK